MSGIMSGIMSGVQCVSYIITMFFKGNIRDVSRVQDPNRFRLSAAVLTVIVVIGLIRQQYRRLILSLIGFNSF